MTTKRVRTLEDVVEQFGWKIQAVADAAGTTRQCIYRALGRGHMVDGRLALQLAMAVYPDCPDHQLDLAWGLVTPPGEQAGRR